MEDKNKEMAMSTAIDEEKPADPSFSILNEADACVKARAFKYEAHDSGQPVHYNRTVVVENTIHSALAYQEKDPKAVMQYMMGRFWECGFTLEQQMQQQVLWDHHRVMRYLKDEGRKPSFPKGRSVKIGSKYYFVKPDAVFPCGDQVDIVMFKVGKPTMTQTGRGNAFQRDLQLYSMILYGRALGYKNITASFYFLRKNRDSSDWNACDQHFFGSSDNIIQVTDIYDGEPNETDKKMAVRIAQNEAGIDPEAQEETTCEYCRNYDICKYTLPPTRRESENTSAATGVVAFSSAQEEAIAFNVGIARIIAVAGSGKTKVMVERAWRLIQSGVKPEEILMVTFTKAAAEEMRARIEARAGKPLPGLKVTTFNALQNEIGCDNYELLDYPCAPRVADNVDEFAIIAELLKNNPILEWNGRVFMNFSASRGYHGNRGALQVAKEVFSACKRSKRVNGGVVNMAHVSSVVSDDEISMNALGKLVNLYDKFEEEMKKRGLNEFDDQEALAFKVIEMKPDYLAKNYKFKHIIVDEFQDTSEGQINFLKEFMKLPTFVSLMVVGDDFQSIYAFRGTSQKFMIHLEEYLQTNIEDICLDINFRSTTEICEYAMRIIAPNRDKLEKSLVAARGHGVPVIVNGFYKSKDEIEYIVAGILQHLANGIRAEDIAVLSYTKNELVKIADALTKAGVPSMFGAPEPVMENSRIRAILAMARVVRDPSNTKSALIAANAVIGGGIMDKEEEEVAAAVAAIVGRAEEMMADESMGKKLFMDFIDEICMDDETVLNFKDTLENKDFAEIINYCQNFDMYGAGVEYRRTRKYPGVALVTAHSSKGLEWPVVYNTITKYQKGARMSSADVEETRRLLFVSATRARDELFVTGLYSNGTKYHPVPNRFLQEAMDAADMSYDCDPTA